MVCSSGKVAAKPANLASGSFDCRGCLWLYPKQVPRGLPSYCVTGRGPQLLAASTHTLARPWPCGHGTKGVTPRSSQCSADQNVWPTRQGGWLCSNRAISFLCPGHVSHRRPSLTPMASLHFWKGIRESGEGLEVYFKVSTYHLLLGVIWSFGPCLVPKKLGNVGHCSGSHCL